MARKFLYIIAVIVFLVIAGAIALTIWSKEATQLAFVPRGEFVAQPALEANAYADPAMWYSRPGMGAQDPARYVPTVSAAPSPESPAAERSLSATPSEPASLTGDVPAHAVFFVHPTSFIQPAIGADAPWNAPL